jgi:hypothetical protein
MLTFPLEAFEKVSRKALDEKDSYNTRLLGAFSNINSLMRRQVISELYLIALEVTIQQLQ